MVNISAVKNCGSVLLRKVAPKNITPETIGYVDKQGYINFLNDKVANNYAKNRVLAALNTEKPFERGLIIDGKRILAEKDGNVEEIHIDDIAHLLPGNSYVHGHPDISKYGSAPVSLLDYLTMVSQKCKKMVAYNSKGEYSSLTQQPQKSIILYYILPKKLWQCFESLAVLGAGSVATTEYAKNYRKLFPTSIQKKMENIIHKKIGTPYADYKKVKEATKNPLTKDEHNQAKEIETECLLNNTFAQNIHEFWKNTAKDLDLKYETNFSNLK